MDNINKLKKALSKETNEKNIKKLSKEIINLLLEKRKTDADVVISIPNINLEGAKLMGANLMGADLMGAKLMEANLIKANLMGADLTNANLTDAKLTRADLTGAYLIGADLTGVVLTDADLTGVVLTDADLTGVKLTGADLTGVKLTGADLTDADLTDVVLTDADLTGADLIKAILKGAKLKDADLTDADLTGADLTGADLTGADLTGAILEDADLTGANLTDVDLTDADLTDADLTGVIGAIFNGNQNPSGVAFEIHNAFTKFNNIKEQYLKLIGQPDDLIDQPEYKGDIYTFIKKKFTDNIIKLFREKQKQTDFNKVFNKIQGFIANEYKQLIAKSISFAFQQNNDFKQQYIITFLDETCNAYSGASDNTSCVKGILERFVLGIGQTVQIICSNGCENETYKKLDKLMNSKFIIADVASEWWQNINKKKQNMTKEERKKNFIQHLRNKAIELNGYDDTVEAEIQKYAETIDDAFDTLTLGGKRLTRKSMKKTKLIKKSMKKTKKNS